MSPLFSPLEDSNRTEEGFPVKVPLNVALKYGQKAGGKSVDITILWAKSANPQWKVSGKPRKSEIRPDLEDLLPAGYTKVVKKLDCCKGGDPRPYVGGEDRFPPTKAFKPKTVARPGVKSIPAP